MIKSTLLLLSLASNAQTSPITEFVSPNNITESCEILPHIPNGVYSKGDVKKEGKLCGINLYDSKNIGLCPKTWSTSAAVLVHNIEKLNTTADKYEAANCKGKTKPDGVKREYKLKTTMNQSDTSGTFSQASLMYYHMSRALDTSLGVPVSVYREMDPAMLVKRVGNKGKANGIHKFNKAAWGYLVNAASNPKAYTPTRDIYTADLKKFYGVAVDDKGERYGTEINGARKGAGYKAQNLEFQETAAFRALRVDSDIKSAIASGLATAMKNATLKKDLVNVSEIQMLFWMRELTELTTLDFIFSQQDRVGNIDYEWKWYWVQDGEVKSEDADTEVPRTSINKVVAPKEIAAFKPVLVQRTHIGDNDAGGRVEYANFTKSTGMLDNIFHYSAKFYTRLQKVSADLQAKGDIYKYFASEFGLNEKQLNQVVVNTKLAADKAKAQCKAGKLRFDLDGPKDVLLNGFTEQSVDCENPEFE